MNKGKKGEGWKSNLQGKEFYFLKACFNNSIKNFGEIYEARIIAIVSLLLKLYVYAYIYVFMNIYYMNIFAYILYVSVYAFLCVIYHSLSSWHTWKSINRGVMEEGLAQYGWFHRVWTIVLAR